MNFNEEDGFAAHDTNDVVTHYIDCAEAACSDGDEDMAVHLYLAAFVYARKVSLVPNERAIAGLKQAWTLACNLHERVLAEYVYELLEPYLTADETAHCAGQLQSLALDKLAEFGLTDDAIQNLAQQISSGMGGAQIVHVGSFKMPKQPADIDADVAEFQIPETVDELLSAGEASTPVEDPAQEGASVPNVPLGPGTKADAIARRQAEIAARDCAQDGESLPKAPAAPDAPAQQVGATDGFDPLDDIPEGANALGDLDPDANVALGPDGFVEVGEDTGTPAVSLGEGFGLRTAPKNGSSETPSDFENMMRSIGDMLQNLKARAIEERSASNAGAGQSSSSQAPAAPKYPDSLTERHDLTFADLVGYGNAINVMKSFGVGVREDPEYEQLVGTLNQMYGLSVMPATDAILFSSLAREDANQFMEAAANETGLPVLRMSIDQNMQGALMLCLSVRADKQPKMKKGHIGFDGPAVLCLEDIDLWMMPPEDYDESQGSWQEHLARGAREAVNLIGAAADDPNVYLFATMSQFGEIDGFFSDLIAPFSIVDIDPPDENERVEIWNALRNDSPSLRDISLSRLIEYSANLPRYDIFTAVREAIEEAYKQSLALRHYVPVSADNLFEKLSAYQPVESEEYQKMEDLIASSLRDELDEFDSVDSLLGLGDFGLDELEGHGGPGPDGLGPGVSDNGDGPSAPNPPAAPDFSL